MLSKSLGMLMVLALILSGQTPVNKCFPDPSYPKTAMFCQTYTAVMWSGPGKSFSQYYAVVSPLQGDEWELSTAAFWLQGPHPCSGTESSPPRLGDPARGKPGGVGTYSDCYQDSKDKRTATWRFSIQGDDSVITGVMVTIPDIPPIRVERNQTVPGRGLLITRYTKNVGDVNPAPQKK